MFCYVTKVICNIKCMLYTISKPSRCMSAHEAPAPAAVGGGGGRWVAVAAGNLPTVLVSVLFHIWERILLRCNYAFEEALVHGIPKSRPRV